MEKDLNENREKNKKKLIGQTLKFQTLQNKSKSGTVKEDEGKTKLNRAKKGKGKKKNPQRAKDIFKEIGPPKKKFKKDIFTNRDIINFVAQHNTNSPKGLLLPFVWYLDKEHWG